MKDEVHPQNPSQEPPREDAQTDLKGGGRPTEETEYRLKIDADPEVIQRAAELRGQILMHDNLDQRANLIYQYIACLIEDLGSMQSITISELSLVTAYMQANVIHDMNRKRTLETQAGIAQLARQIKKAHKEQMRKEHGNVVPLPVRNKVEEDQDAPDPETADEPPPGAPS